MAPGLIAILLASGAPAAAAAPAPPPPKPPLICRESDQQLGSHIHSGRCMTAEQWQQEDARRSRIPLTMQQTRDPEDANKKPPR